ncbi:hypothetical protein SALBM311S_05891 [Streptomyces alboniger]
MVPLEEWNAAPDRPYAPASLAVDGFADCSPDAETTLAVVNAFYRNAETAADAGPRRGPAGLPAGVGGRGARSAARRPGEHLVPYVFGPLNRDAVERVA